MSRADVLIVGGDGLLGRMLRRWLAIAGASIHASTRRPDLVGADRPFVDLREAHWPALSTTRYEVAVLAAAISHLRTCETDPATTARVNVDGTARLAASLAARGTRVILLSSSQVFDGKTRFPRPSDPVSPVNEYGRQKAEAERMILSLDGGSVLRMTKVLSPDMALLQGWAADLSRSQPIFPFADMHLSPVPLDAVCAAIVRMILRKTTGIVQLSASDDMSYAELATVLDARLGPHPGLVRPGPRPPTFTDGSTGRRWSALDTSRLELELDLEIPDPIGVARAVVEALVASLGPARPGA